MQNRTILVPIITLSLFFCGCSKDKTVTDPGPNFSLDSMEVKLTANESSVTPIHRDDRTSGPQIQIQAGAPSAVTATERKLTCGTLVLQGKKVQAPDPSLLNFRLADEEFPGLNGLPLRANCKLTVIMTNNVGSTSTKIIPVTLSFDKIPGIEVTRRVATAGLIPHTDRFEIATEKYLIKNNLSYNVGFTFSPKRSLTTVYLKYKYHVRDYITGPATQELYNAESVSAVTSRIDIEGFTLQQFGDLIHEIRFVLPPGGTIAVTSYAQLPSENLGTRCFPASWGIGVPLGTPGHCRTFVGGYVTGVSDARPSRSLSMWRGFEATPEDITDPAYIEFRDDIPFPGVTVDPALLSKRVAD